MRQAERYFNGLLEEGKLVQVGSTRIPSNLAYYLCWREGDPKQDAILQFMAWLEEMVRQKDRDSLAQDKTVVP